MLESSRTRILSSLDDGDVVLDIGGWANPLPRADWVMDLMPYETRGLYGGLSTEVERFGPATWIQRDICARDPYPFEDDEIDLVVCSHTLEDVRDPVWVCQEMMRVAKRGYVEVPSRLEEQSYGFQGPWTGWAHHHWLVDVVDGGITFVFKHGVVHGRDSDRFGDGFRNRLTPEERVQTLWWEDAFDVRELVFTGAEELDAYLASFVASHGHPRRPSRWDKVARLAHRASRLTRHG